MPLPRGGAVGVTFRFEDTIAVFMLGGANRIDMLFYNWKENAWFRGYSFGVPRNMSFTSVVATSPERIYVLGGADETGAATDTVYIGEAFEGDM